MKRPTVWLLAGYILLILGLRACGISLRHRAELEHYPVDGVPCEMTGRLFSVRPGSGGSAVLQLKRCRVLLTGADAPVTDPQEAGRVLVYLGEEAADTLAVGDYVRLQGEIASFREADNPGEFDAKAYYLARNTVYYVNAERISTIRTAKMPLRETARRLRERLRGGLQKTLDAEEAGIAAALLLGDRSLLTEETKKVLEAAGLSHILSVSGLHVSLVGGGLWLAAKWLLSFVCWEKKKGIWGRDGFTWLAFLLAGGGTLFYVLLAGEGTGLLRAGIMFFLMLAAGALGRSYDMESALAAAALSVLIPYPEALFTSSFQLSFGCVYIVSVPVPWVVERWQLQTGAGKAAAAAMLLQLFMLPLMLRHFYVWHLWTLPVNLIVLPVLPWILGGAAGAALGGAFLLPLGYVAAAPTHVLMQLLLKLSGMAASLPGASVVLGCPELRQLFLYACAAGAVIWLMTRDRSRELRREGGLRISGKSKIKLFLQEAMRLLAPLLLFFLVLPWIFALRRPRGVRITSLYVGQGDAAVVETPDGTWLIDGGNILGDPGADVILPFLRFRGIRKLDGIFVSHPDIDHFSGLETVLRDRGIRTGKLYIPAFSAAESKLSGLLGAAGETGTAVCLPERGDRIICGQTVFSVLHPPAGMGAKSGNDASLVLQLSFGSFDALFPGDLGLEGEAGLLQAGILTEVEWLKVGHHGSKNAGSSAFLRQIRPLAATVSCGRGNVYGHPHADALRRLEEAGVRVYRTDRQGAVTVEADPDGRFRIKTFRNSPEGP